MQVFVLPDISARWSHVPMIFWARSKLPNYQCDQDALNDKAVTMSDELRQALNQFLVMRKEGAWDEGFGADVSSRIRAFWDHVENETVIS